MASSDSAARRGAAKICAHRLPSRPTWPGPKRPVQGFFARWMRILPSPFTQAERARYDYGLAVRQLEVSDTCVFDRPAAGRAWFEQTLRDQLGLGHPDRVQIVFDRKVTRRTPGVFQTQVITRGVAPVTTCAAYAARASSKEFPAASATS